MKRLSDAGATGIIAAIGAVAAIGTIAAIAACGDRAAPRAPGAPSGSASSADAARMLDAFDDLAPWKASGSEGVTASVRAAPGATGTGQALRLELDLGGTSGYAVARRDLPLELPEDFELSFELRGEVPINHLELKLIDETGENVWWYRRANHEFPASWRRVAVKRRQIEFAWGPTKDRTLRRIAAIEVVVAAGRGGGKGAIEIDQLALRPRAPVPVPPPALLLRASSTAPGSAAARAIDGQADTAWISDPSEGAAQQLTVDLGVERDLGGLLVRWADRGAASDYRVELSRDGAAWQPAAEVAGGDGGLDPIPLPDASARYVRLSLTREAPYGLGGYRLAELTVLDADAAGTPNAFAAALARALPRGHLPRAQLGEQPYWTVVGADGGSQTALLSEDGAVELRAGATAAGALLGGASIEPFVETSTGVTSWANAGEIAQSLEDRYLPIPRVVWRTQSWELEITALATPADPTQAQLAVRYTLRNRTPNALAVRLVLAVRPLQVNPPPQFLNIAGGVRPIHRLAWADGALAIDGEPAIRPLVLPNRVSLWPLHSVGYPVAKLATTPAEITDPTGFASGALAYHIGLAPRGESTVVVLAPLAGALPPAPVEAASAGRAAVWFERALAAAKQSWHASLDRVGFRVPAAGQPIIDTLRSSLAYMLISRDGPILRPGTRSYARAWIRDGAMISEALLRLRHPDVAAAFLRWYAPYQFASGKVPCCVEPTGAVPVPEHDSHGQLIFLAAELYRYTRDRALLESLWPNVQAAARAIDELRRSERTPANQTPERRARYGLMPPSISHEGYSARPAYSYWDDFWTLTGLSDAAWLATQLGDAQAAAALTASRDEFQRDLLASIAASAADHRVPYIPGAADLGDFDATSTTIALAPAGLQRALPPELLAATFERAWQQLSDRRPGGPAWNDYTPYELRLVGSFVRLGWRTRTEQALARYFEDRRPPGWNQWAEVVGREARQPRFIGDMPHAWVHSDYARSALDLFAYHRPDDRAIVLAAGIPPAWFEGTGFAVTDLATPYGPLSYEVRSTARELTISLPPGPVPPGGFVFPWPFATPPGAARSSGRTATWRGAPPELVIDRRPVSITITRPGALP